MLIFIQKCGKNNIMLVSKFKEQNKKLISKQKINYDAHLQTFFKRFGISYNIFSTQNIVAHITENFLAVVNVEKLSFHFLQFSNAASAAKKTLT